MPDNRSIQLRQKSTLADPRKISDHKVVVSQDQLNLAVTQYLDRHLANIAVPRATDPLQGIPNEDRALRDRWLRHPASLWLVPVVVVSSILFFTFVGLFVLALALLGVSASQLLLGAIVLGCFLLVAIGVIYLVYTAFKE